MKRNDPLRLAGVALTSLLTLTVHAQQPDASRVEQASLSAPEAAARTTALDIDPAQFEALFANIKPAESELRWLEIPWLGTILEGRQAAMAAKKPMFLWAMNGHPLGTC